MKTKLLYLLFAICTAYTISSCKKDEDKNTTPSADISGVWMQTRANIKEWKNGLFANEVNIDYKPDSSILIYKTDKTFTIHRNEILYRTGTYTVDGNKIIINYSDGNYRYRFKDSATFLLIGNSLIQFPKYYYTYKDTNFRKEYIEYFTKKN